MVEYDIAIVGGGIFGCSIARHLSIKSDAEICLLEKEYHLAQHQSGRNSGTLHLGVVTEADVEPGSQLAKFTIEGTRRLKSYCLKHDLPLHDRGIMKVGDCEEEQEKVREMYHSALESGVEVDLLESREEIRNLEPNISGKNALFSPESATVDTGPITNKLAQEAYENGANLYMGCEVKQIKKSGDRLSLRTNKDTIEADYLINAAGTKALEFAQTMGIGQEYQAVPFRGAYYELVPERRSLVNSNVYPTNVGESFQVGVHFTRRPDSRVIVGPTGMIALGSETYGKTDFNIREIYNTISSRNFLNFIGSKDTLLLAWDELNKTYRKSSFLRRCQKLIPEIKSGDLEESYVGISHWLFNQEGERIGEPIIDIGENATHLIMPQPGFTAALTTGEYISEGVLDHLSSVNRIDNTKATTD
ncbi:NAD(P)/FAD-dependent oxidoreductase [Halorubrum trueperi]|uniref:NAD(P)/FAD-dependent oxidoreductase n=1 Tax=Halorubrum trueperi TaxID=2004704 RepID=A0ABD5UH41_9EURY